MRQIIICLLFVDEHIFNLIMSQPTTKMLQMQLHWLPHGLMISDPGNQYTSPWNCLNTMQDNIIDILEICN